MLIFLLRKWDLELCPCSPKTNDPESESFRFLSVSSDSPLTLEARRNRSIHTSFSVFTQAKYAEVAEQLGQGVVPCDLIRGAVGKRLGRLWQALAPAEKAKSSAQCQRTACRSRIQMSLLRKIFSLTLLTFS